MALLTQNAQQDLLDALSQMGSYGRAEGEDDNRFPLSYSPIPEHLRAFDPDVVMVVGPRGAGKTELFKAGVELGLLPAVSRRLPRLRLTPSAQTEYLKAFPLGREFPDGRGLKQFVAGNPGAEALMDLWFAYLVRTLAPRLAQKGLAPLMKPSGGDPAAVLSGFQACAQAPLLALDNLDAQLERDNAFIFLGYDELDTFGQGDWHTVNLAVQGLVALWSSMSRRWRRIRAKLFLRTDLYERAGVRSGADFAKLAANRADITWSDASLYAMLVKRIANASDELFDYCKAKVTFESDETLGQIPAIRTAADGRPLIERMVGTYMGANARKGLTYTWLLDHVRDGRGHALPRALVRLIEQSAEVQKKSGKLPRSPRLLEPWALRRALDRVSEEHVKQSQSEWPWIEGLKTRLKNDREVPWDRRQIERVLAKNWEDPWGTSEDVTPPAESPRELVDYLLEVGVFRERSGDRIDVPDLFLLGLGLVRRGGVARS